MKCTLFLSIALHMSIEQPTSNLVGLLMSIKEYKLGDICNVKTGNMNKIDAKEDGKYNFFTRSVNILKSDRYTADGNFTIIPGEGVFMPLYAEGKIAVHQRVYYIEANKNFSRDKYLYYWWTKNAFLLNLSAVGTTVKSLRLNNLIKPIIKLPDIETQQQIIDIIEPKENLFIKYKDLVNIESLDEFKKTWSILIDIIEPFEKMLNKEKIYIDILNNCLIFISNYISTEDKIHFLSIVNFCGTKYRNQKKYIDTSNISKSIIKGYESIVDKRKSRANLTVENKSIIFSKLKGENKIYPIFEDVVMY